MSASRLPADGGPSKGP